MGCVSSKATADHVTAVNNNKPLPVATHEVNTQIQVQPSPKALVSDSTRAVPPIDQSQSKAPSREPSKPASPKSSVKRLAAAPTEQPAAVDNAINATSQPVEVTKVSRYESAGSKRGTLRSHSRRQSSETKGLRPRAASIEPNVINYAPAVSSNNSSLNSTLTSDPKLKAAGSSMPGSIASTAPGVLERAPSFNTLLKTAHPSLLLSDPAYQTNKIAETFMHYYKKKYESGSDRDRSTRSSKRNTGESNHEEERIDKKGLGQLATDSVLSFLHVVRETNTWKPEKWEKKEREERLRYLPGQTLAQAVDIAKLYWQQELQYKSGGVTKTMFFFHFARAYKAMFSYDGKLTIEREALVAKWNKIGPERLEEKAKAKQEKESARDNTHEKSVSKTDRSTRRSSGRTASKDLKPRKNRATAPANSISQLLASGGLNHDSKLVQAEKKLSSHLSATASEAKNPIRPTSSSTRRG